MASHGVGPPISQTAGLVHDRTVQRRMHVAAPRAYRDAQDSHACCRWLGVDRVFLRENGLNVSEQYMGAFQEMEDAGFLNFGAWEGQSPEAQQLWYNRCAQEDLAGEMSWILFSDLDEFPVHMNGCASPLHCGYFCSCNPSCCM